MSLIFIRFSFFIVIECPFFYFTEVLSFPRLQGYQLKNMCNENREITFSQSTVLEAIVSRRAHYDNSLIIRVKGIMLTVRLQYNFNIQNDVR